MNIKINININVRVNINVNVDINVTTNIMININIDVDIYEPTRDSLDFFYSRLSNDGCMHLDDYNFREWPGSKIALDNFLKKIK